MSDHSITWEVEDDDGEPWPHSPQVTCNAPEGALCHSVPDCDCEQIAFEKSPDGSVFHVYYNCEDDEEVIHTHHQSAGYCNYREWVTEDITGRYGGDLPHAEHHNGGITFTWDTDFYTWDYVTGEAS